MRLRRVVFLARLLVCYLFMDSEQRAEMRAVLRRQAWEARLMVAETARLAQQARHLAEEASPRSGNEEVDRPRGEGPPYDSLDR